MGPQLAYSMTDDEPLPMEMPMAPLGELIPEQDEDATQYTAAVTPAPPRMLLMGSAVGFLVISFATLAVAVAINVRPTAAVSDLPTPAPQSDAVPGRYLPPVPHQPDPVSLPVAELTPAPAQSNSVPRSNNSPGNRNVPSAPAPARRARTRSTAASAGGRAADPGAQCPAVHSGADSAAADHRIPARHSAAVDPAVEAAFVAAVVSTLEPAVESAFFSTLEPTLEPAVVSPASVSAVELRRRRRRLRRLRSHR